MFLQILCEISGCYLPESAQMKADENLRTICVGKTSLSELAISRELLSGTSITDRITVICK